MTHLIYKAESTYSVEEGHLNAGMWDLSLIVMVHMLRSLIMRC